MDHYREFYQVLLTVMFNKLELRAPVGEPSIDYQKLVAYVKQKDHELRAGLYGDVSISKGNNTYTCDAFHSPIHNGIVVCAFRFLGDSHVRTLAKKYLITELTKEQPTPALEIQEASQKELAAHIREGFKQAHRSIQEAMSTFEELALDLALTEEKAGT